MNNNMTPLSLDDSFSFSCSKSIPCFNECCKDLNQFLTPYDILRLKNNLQMTSADFLERYTSRHTGPESGLPIITLKPEDSSELICPFVTPSGCSVYEDRPASCRTYPLARLASRPRKTNKITEHYMLLNEQHCLGFDHGQMWTVWEWIEDQGIAEYNRMNDMMMEIISLKNRQNSGPLDLKSQHLFHMAFYDLDNFKSHIFEKGLLDDMNLDSETLDSIQKSDEALLKVGIEWIKHTLFAAKIVSIQK